MTLKSVKEGANYFSLYLEYTSKTECPTFFHRWTALSTLSAWLGRDVHLPFGHFNVHANMYVMFVGLAGTKKSTAIKIGAKLLKEAGYTNFAARKTRQEKFLVDLAGGTTDLRPEEDILEANLFGDTTSTDASEVFVPADEINNFIGVGNLDFMSILGELWDFEGMYDYNLKNSKDVKINNPTVSILGGNTFAGFNKLFPPEAIEQGFFSRMLFIYAEPTGVKYTIPEPPDLAIQAELVEVLHNIKAAVSGKFIVSSEAYDLLDLIYKAWDGLDDSRFDAYENRRIIHLLKLCMLIAAADYTNTVTSQHVVQANTILTFTEHLMPKALGEFGLARNSGVTHKVMQTIDSNTSAGIVSSFQKLWKAVHIDLERREQLQEILFNLSVAEKIQTIDSGYLAIKKKRSEVIKEAVDWNLLTKEERGLL